MSGNRLTVAIDEFRASLSADQRVQFDSTPRSTPTATDVVDLTAEIDKKNSSRRSRVWSQRTRGILDCVQQYCTIVNTFVQADPAIAALVWGSVRFAILAALNFSDYFENLSRRFEQLGKDCPRFDEYQKIFNGSVRVREALSEFYATVIGFCTKALPGIQEKGIKRFVKSLIKPYSVGFGPLEVRLTAAKEEVDAEIRLASEQSAQSSLALLQSHRSDFRVESQRNSAFRLVWGTG